MPNHFFDQPILNSPYQCPIRHCINAVRRPGSKHFTRGFPIVSPGLTIRDRLRVLQPNDPDSYYASRELVPHDLLEDLERFRREIIAGITRAFVGARPVKALLAPYNPAGSTRHVRFNTSKTDRWDTSRPPPKYHLNWVVLDSDGEAEFCRVAEEHPKVLAYVKNHHLGLEVPYRYGSEMRRYLPDFIVLVDDGRGPEDPLHLIVEIKGYRGEDAKEKASTMRIYWVPGVNHLGTHGRWAFAEFCDVYEIETDFKAKVERHFQEMMEKVLDEPQRTQRTQRGEAP